MGCRKCNLNVQTLSFGHTMICTSSYQRGADSNLFPLSKSCIVSIRTNLIDFIARIIYEKYLRWNQIKHKTKLYIRRPNKYQQ